MPFAIDPELIENEHVQITEDENSNLALEHKPTGRVLTLDDDVTVSDLIDTDDIAAAIDGHQQNDVHAEPQPPEEHGNDAHEGDYYSEGDNPVFGETETGSLRTERADITDDSTITLEVPSDYSTLNDAIEAAATINTSQFGNVVINIESGHSVEDGVIIEGPADLSNVVIMADDSTVPVASDFTGYLIRGMDRVSLPTLDCVIDMDGSGSRGYSVEIQSDGYVTGDGGVINAGSDGLYLNKSHATADHGADFSGAEDRGLWVTRGSRVSAQNVDCSDAGEIGATVRRGSVADLMEIDCTNAGQSGIYITRAFSNIKNADGSNAGDRGIHVTQGSYVNAHAATATDCDNDAVLIREGSTANLYGADLANANNFKVRLESGYAITTGANVTRGDTNATHINAVSPEGLVIDEGEPAYDWIQTQLEPDVRRDYWTEEVTDVNEGAVTNVANPTGDSDANITIVSLGHSDSYRHGIDVVTWIRDGSTETISSLDTGDFSTRTYGVDGGSLTIEFAEEGEQEPYNVLTTTFGGRHRA